MSIWINDSKIERNILNALVNVEDDTSRFLEDYGSHEVPLTGSFIIILKYQLEPLKREIEEWAAKEFKGNAIVNLDYEDIASKGLEKDYGADFGFHLIINIDDHLYSERGLLVQAKNPRFKSDDSEQLWEINRPQLSVLMCRSPFSVYFLYGLNKTDVKIRVIPASYVKNILNKTGKKSISPKNIKSFSRKFSNFFLYDFIGNWWGDTDESVLNIVRGTDDLVKVRHIFRIEISVKKEEKDNKN
ncbi:MULTISPECIES: hypothetical protein [Methanobacterium]|uniref:Restriction endonuclease n=1 Tax=Methanobacterium bryantii TaxID=2161 RepID=A0A2A2H3M8_METBR|nr:MULTISPECIES: hypothetical protein [Methanobacterium]OEC86741.1 hypothetical protein A9507_09845 [Methanobacterium sp. A39]PAV04019.1 hypothetical protein ASJ80_03120 [Methanobacterium bryantii]